MTPAVWEVQELLDQAEEERDRYREALEYLASEAKTNPKRIEPAWVGLFVTAALRSQPTNAELGQQLTAVMAFAQACGYRGAAEWIARVYGGMDDPLAASQDIRSREP